MYSSIRRDSIRLESGNRAGEKPRCPERQALDVRNEIPNEALHRLETPMGRAPVLLMHFTHEVHHGKAQIEREIPTDNNPYHPFPERLSTIAGGYQYTGVL